MHCFIAESIDIIDRSSLASEVFVVNRGDKASIQIEHLKDLRDFVYTRTSGRDVIIEEAHLMNIVVQNKLLKMLEEPPSGVRFFLLTEHPSRLLETVRSRAIFLKGNVSGDYTDHGTYNSLRRGISDGAFLSQAAIDIADAIDTRRRNVLFKDYKDFKEIIPEIFVAVRNKYIDGMYQTSYTKLLKILDTLDDVQSNLAEGSNFSLERDRFFISILED